MSTPEIRPPAGIMLSIKNIPFFGTSLNNFLGKNFWQKGKDGALVINKQILGIVKSGDRQNAEHQEPECPRGPFNDGIDRLNAYYVPAILFALVAIIEALGSFQPETSGISAPGASGPVWCLKTSELNEEQFNYALEFCQSRNHYYVEPTDWIAWRRADQVRRQIGYYHWIAIVLFLQGVWFMIPNIIWIYVQRSAGVDFGKFIGWAQELAKFSLNNSIRHDGVRKMARQLYSVYFPLKLIHRKRHARFFGCRIGKSRGPSIALLYLCFKLIYVATAILQFLWMNAFIGDGKDYFWGMAIIDLFAHNDVWQDSRIFPRQTFCTIPIRRLGDTAYYTLQCHLRVNTYLEKIFFFAWCLLILVAFFALLNALYFAIRLLFFPWFIEVTICNLLRQREFDHIMASESEEEIRKVTEFKEHLGCEGICLFWFIQSNAGPIITRDLAGEMFNIFLGGNVLCYRKGFNVEKARKKAEALRKQVEDRKYRKQNKWGSGSGWGKSEPADNGDSDENASDDSFNQEETFEQPHAWEQNKQGKKKEKVCRFNEPDTNNPNNGDGCILTFNNRRPPSHPAKNPKTVGSKIAGMFGAKPQPKNDKEKA